MKRTIIFLSILSLITGSFSQTGENTLNKGTDIRNQGGLSQAEPVSGSGNGSRGKIDFSLNFLPGFSIGGAGLNLGSEIEIFDESSWIEQGSLPDGVFDDYRLDYGDKITPILTSPAPGTPVSLDLGYTYDKTRIGLSWFRWTASDEQSGRVKGLHITDEGNGEEFGYGYVSFWNMGLDLHASRGYPASWFEGFRDHDVNGENGYQGTFDPEKGVTEWMALHETSMNYLQMTVRHPVIDGEKLNLNIVGGLQYGRWKDNLVQLLNMTAHTELTDRWTQYVLNEAEDDSIEVIVYLDYIFDNDITLTTNSSASFNSLGVMAGVEAQWNVFPSLSFNIQAGGATLSGDASYSGLGSDVDDIDITDILTVYDLAGNLLLTDPLRGYEFLSGRFELPGYTRSIVSVNYRLNFGISYEINNVISLKAGYFYSLWKNLPLSPRWTYSDKFTRPYDAFALEESWDTNLSTVISTSGFNIGIGFTF